MAVHVLTESQSGVVIHVLTGWPRWPYTCINGVAKVAVHVLTGWPRWLY